MSLSPTPAGNPAPDDLPPKIIGVAVAAGTGPAYPDRVYAVQDDGTLWICHKPNANGEWVYEPVFANGNGNGNP